MRCVGGVERPGKCRPEITEQLVILPLGIDAEGGLWLPARSEESRRAARADEARE